ncbi:MAG TPA: M23 family metallopeptidase, partial [Candidatus Baltobacteraceae bacterium]|nr:M23 family metallopeptidase [Candidatus Baltobacteraceae bacterium]
RWWNRAADPIVLESPFADAWYVAAGGPEPRHNHHQVASDQYFAYDFLPEEGEAWDREILAPCDGTVAWTEDRHDDTPPGERRRDRRNPAGNYVSIETKRGFVLLGHLKRGSIAVRVADTVRAGMPIARCGNSGNTSQSHLHLHAQDRPQVAIDIARGVPVAFLDENGIALVLEYGDVLQPVTFASPA